MTELRNQPGEILDRVADKGEAFIIERNGKRKACLIPLSLFFPDVSPIRIADELKELEEHGEKARITITEKRELVFSFPQELTGQDEIELTIVLPHGYPNNCPRVYADPIAGKVPHRWSDGALCLYGVMSVWNPGQHGVFSTLVFGRKWLQHYDAWRQDGRWPKEEGSPNE